MFLKVNMHFRFYASEIRKAATEMRQEYQSDIMGKVALAIYRHHKGCPTTYKLCDEAQDYFDGILDNLASQFNSHYDIEESITESQTQLDAEQRADIDVCTKAGELIGHLSAVLWIYNNGNELHIIFMFSQLLKNCIICYCLFNLHTLIITFSCISQGKQFRTPEEISLKCIKSAESIVNMSYSQAKVYTSVNILHGLTICPYTVMPFIYVSSITTFQ